ncbi:RluA family pseudouridine synthase [Sulfurimonas crateris]|uniref:RNA pseudouridylate synthase n=1 Tax=Sulfurimonas crateris TaxID=2574727 RepID=A0A4U2ZB24_9BACT|nr:RluA family pseudouridine synthase [Sulfurimonas crateris]TKI70852.1 RluA family pseudouridine synthase [Sulfurimonas crateris]
MPFVLKKMFVKQKQRAFVFLIRELGYTQKEAQRFIAKGRLLINGEIMDVSSREIEGEIEFITFEPLTKGLKAYAEYENFVVFDKPSGMLIHPQNRYTPYSLIDELKAQYGRDANIAHRIDQETSGLVLCARDKKSEIDLKMMFQEREMKKRYLAMVHGELKDELKIDAPLLRYDDEKSALIRMVVKVDESGKESLTYVKPLKYFPELNTTLVECSPHTGRQHQIRVHLFHVKHPIVGDPVYGQSEEYIVKYLDRELDREIRVKMSGAKRLLLHANELEFEFNGKTYNIKSSIDFEKVCLENMRLT